jgi:RNA recognition motif-containing protein
MTSIFVAKLDFGITGEQLKQAFEQHGTVLKASVATDRETGKSRGFGFVEMANRDEAMAAIENLDGSMMNGRPIAVKEAEQRTDSRPPRDSNSPRPDFKRREGFDNNRDSRGSSESRPSEYRKPADDAPAFIPPILPDAIKGEVRKKVDKDKKPKDWDSEGRAKKPKMNAYKKSGKNNRFFGDDDDDDELDIHSFNNYDDEELEEEDNDYEDDED